VAAGQQAFEDGVSHRRTVRGLLSRSALQQSR